MKQRKIPVRMCVSCGEMQNKNDLFRIVRSPDGAVSVDLKGKASGRGAYLCKKVECVAQAMKRKVLERNLNIGGCGDIYASLTEMCGEDGSRE